MNLITKILPRLAILEIFFEDAESYMADLSVYGFDGVTAELQARISNAQLENIVKEVKEIPLLIAYGGFGIISKNVETNPEIVEKIKSDRARFIWDETATEITFLRRVQIENVVKEYRLDKNIPLAVFCFAGLLFSAFQNAVLDRSSAYYKDTVNLPVMLKPSQTGSILCRLAALKLKLPVFAVLMLLLVVNLFADRSVRAKYNSSQVRLCQLEKRRGQEDQAAARNRQLFAEFDQKPPFEYSWLCDRAGIVLPEGIILSLIIIQPVKKALENGKKPLLEHNRIIIKGNAPEAEDITYYTNSLGKLIQPANVKLTSMERTREKDRLEFSISIDLL